MTTILIHKPAQLIADQIEEIIDLFEGLDFQVEDEGTPVSVACFDHPGVLRLHSREDFDRLEELMELAYNHCLLLAVDITLDDPELNCPGHLTWYDPDTRTQWDMRTGGQDLEPLLLISEVHALLFDAQKRKNILAMWRSLEQLEVVFPTTPAGAKTPHTSAGIRKLIRWCEDLEAETTVTPHGNG